MRLTNDMRDTILRNTIKGVFQKRSEDLKQENNALALLVYDQLYPTDVQTAMSKLPDEFFNQKSEVVVQPSESTNVNDLIFLTLASSKKVAAVDNGWRRPRWDVRNIDNAVTQRIQKYVKQQKKLELDEENLRHSVKTMLAGIHTMKRLAEEWPDGEAYYKGLLPTPPAVNLPAVRGADVTSMILELGEGGGE